uniref:spore germination protein n=1 Tax=Paenibacillus sp. FSL R10-2782 TaxID=2954661 RepID=UPI00406C78CE
MADNCNSYTQMYSVNAGYLFVPCIFTHLVGVRQIKTVDGRESRRKEQIELLEECDHTEENAHVPAESKDSNVRRNEDESYSEDYEANVTKMRQAITDMADVNEKSIFLDHLQARVSLFCVDGLTDRASMDQNIIKPLSESVLRGPRIGFTEVLSDNTALFRRYGESTELAMHSFKVGKRVQKQLMVVYFRDIANSELVEEVKRRIKTIGVDEVMESGYVEQLIEDNFLSPFMQIQNTERPSKNEHKNEVGGMVLYKRSGRFCPRISTPL